MTARAAPATAVEPWPTAAQARFDPLAEPRGVHTLRGRRGRTLHYLDSGAPGGRTLVFFGGLGTSVGAFSLTEFARSTRESLGLRAVSVERNGFGRTPFDPARGYREGTDDVLDVLAALGIERFAIVAISGGGPHAAALAARVPERVISLHLAAAAAGSAVARSRAGAELLADPAALAADPAGFWRYPAGSPVHRIPRFAEAAAREGARALGTASGAQALAHEWALLCSEPLPDLRSVRAPTYLYGGAEDELVPPEHLALWLAALGGVVTVRSYEGEGHDVQYRHWDQILVDAAGSGGRVLICQDGAARLVAEAELEERLAAGATLGLCAWAVGARTARRSTRVEAGNG